MAKLYSIIASENQPKDKISVKAQALLDAYHFEKNKADAVKDFERPKP